MSDKVVIGGVAIDRVSREGLAQEMIEDAKRPLEEPRLVFCINGQGISMAARDSAHMADIQKADVMHADGMSLIFASRMFTGRPLPERIATTDFFHDAARAASKEGLKFYLLGATEEVVRKAFDRSREMYPGVQWVGYHNGYFTEDEEEEICAKIVASGADVVWVGMGEPRQKTFCVRNAHRLKGVTWLKTCGGLFDFVAGKNRRAPEWMQSMGLEWLYRTFLEPRRLFLRYFITNPHAIWLFVTRSDRLFVTQSEQKVEQP